MGDDLEKPLSQPSQNSPALSCNRRRLRAWAVVAGVVLVPALAGVGVWAALHWRGLAAGPGNEAPGADRPEDPRLAYAGPFRNIRPEVAFVGDDKCAECHQDQSRTYREHPMGRSLLPVSRIAASQRYDAAAHNPFEAFGTQFLVEHRDKRVLHKQVGRDESGQSVFEADVPIDYVLGSGTRGYSYLTDRDGYLFQSPISWFSQKQIWDLSPGFAEAARSGRPVLGLCLSCHANHVRPIEGYINRYEKPMFDGYAIGCERCHGPGAEHVKDPGRRDSFTGADYTIVNPHHLKPELRAAVCEQCHITGEARVLHRGRGLFDFRPGLAAEDFWSVYVHETVPNEPQKAVSHVEQMYLSRCFQRSEERPAEGKRKLGCTSCHDPHQHVPPEERVAHYRPRCLECHGEQQCTAPKAARLANHDSCIDCHMPRFPSADIAHNASTDHRILRRPREDAPAASSPSRREPGIVSFYRQRPGRDDAETERDLGIALTHVMVQTLAQRKLPPTHAGDRAISALESAVRNDPEDLPALEAKADVLALVNRPAEALTVYEAVLARSPHWESSLESAAMLAQSRQQKELALGYLRRAVAENPWHAHYRADLAQFLAEQKAWDEARPQCEAWLRLDPPNIDARFLWVRCLLRTGDSAMAKAEFGRIERLRPPNLAQLQARFAVESRPR
jgi:tetratricopeptide (TPR) repeat protein